MNVQVLALGIVVHIDGKVKLNAADGIDDLGRRIDVNEDILIHIKAEHVLDELFSHALNRVAVII